MAKYLLTYALAFVVFAAATMPCAGPSKRLRPFLSTDAIDKAIVASLALDATDSRVDINADHSVDILDLQELIAEATKPQAPCRESSEGTAPEGAIPESTRLNLPAYHGEMPSFHAQGESIRSEWRASMDSVLKSPGEPKRNRYSLTPHAPPLCA